MSQTSTVSGTITYFDKIAGYGYVRVRGERRQFGCTTWHPGRPARWPKRNEKVEVVFVDGDRLLSVRAVR